MVELMNSPVFIIGNPRSGTTLLRLMLTSHRNIVIPPECGFAVWWYEKYKDWGKSGTVDDIQLSTFIRDLMQSRKIETWQINEEELFQFLQTRRPISYSELASSVYEWYGLSCGRSFTRWGDKNNFHVNYVLTIKEIFPDAFFVHIVRDGRDVACSYKEINARKIDSPYAPSLPDDIEDIASQWKANIETATDSFARVGWENVCRVKFEDLIINTEASLRNLCHQIGEDFDPSLLNYYQINKENKLEPREFLKWKEKTLKKPTEAVISRYKKELTKSEVSIFERIAGDILRKEGYL